MILDNLINDLRRERDKAQERAAAAGQRGDTITYHQEASAERAFCRAIEIAERYSGFPDPAARGTTEAR